MATQTASPIELPPPQPTLGLRFTISAAFASCAIGLLPFFLIGLLVRFLIHPFNMFYDWYSTSKKHRRPRQNRNAAGAAPVPAALAVAPPTGRRTPPQAHVSPAKQHSNEWRQRA